MLRTLLSRFESGEGLIFFIRRHILFSVVWDHFFIFDAVEGGGIERLSGKTGQIERLSGKTGQIERLSGKILPDLVR